jgi:hypothetical protein
VVLDADGRRPGEPRDLHLWEPVEPPDVRIGVVSPVDPIDYGLAPQALA